jgi:hypothetical protein
MFPISEILFRESIVIKHTNKASPNVAADVVLKLADVIST